MKHVCTQIGHLSIPYWSQPEFSRLGFCFLWRLLSQILLFTSYTYSFLDGKVCLCFTVRSSFILFTSIYNLSSLQDNIAPLLSESWFLGNPVLHNSKTTQKTQGDFHRRTYTNQIENQMFKICLSNHIFLTHIYIICFHFLSSIFVQLPRDILNSCCISLFQ